MFRLQVDSAAQDFGMAALQSNPENESGKAGVRTDDGYMRQLHLSLGKLNIALIAKALLALCTY